MSDRLTLQRWQHLATIYPGWPATLYGLLADGSGLVLRWVSENPGYPVDVAFGPTADGHWLYLLADTYCRFDVDDPPGEPGLPERQLLSLLEAFLDTIDGPADWLAKVFTERQPLPYGSHPHFAGLRGWYVWIPDLPAAILRALSGRNAPPQRRYGAVRARLVAAFVNYHLADPDLKREPLTVAQLAKLAQCDKSTASRFLQSVCPGGYQQYLDITADSIRLFNALYRLDYKAAQASEAYRRLFEQQPAD